MKFVILEVGLLFILGIFLSNARDSRCITNSKTPLGSWANIKNRFKAVGNGAHDDTEAFQIALDSLSDQFTNYNMNTKSMYFVIYLPAGTYVLSSTLKLTGKMGVSIIGEDKSKVRIKWKGPAKDTMLVANGSSYFKISNITWDNGGVSNVEAIGIHWLDKITGKYAPTSIELSDLNFEEGFYYGISGGTNANEGTGANDAEVVINNCTFKECRKAGVAIHGYNALDYWIWNSEFIGCNNGIMCDRGNYHAYNCTFIRSTNADMENSDGYYISARGCKSINSNQFSKDLGGSCNAFKRIFQDNYIEGALKMPIEYYSQGRLTLMNNFFRKSRASTNVTINFEGWCPAIYQAFSLNNYFEDSVGIRIGSNHRKHLFSIKDRNNYKGKPEVRVSGIISNVEKAIPAGIVYEIHPDDNTLKIQRTINAASSRSGKNARPIVHFQPGEYILDRSLIIPSGSSIELVGDGIINSTVFIAAAGMKDEALIWVKGPSQVVLRDFELRPGGESIQSGIRFDNIDQKRSEVRIDQLYSGAQTALMVKNYNYTYFEKNNSFYSSGNVLIGGKVQNAGKGTFKMNCFGGQGVRTTLDNNAQLVAKDCWWEGASRKDFLPLDFVKGSGKFSISGAMIAPADIDTTSTIRIGDFGGQITLTDMYIYGGLEITGTRPDLKVLAWNINLMLKTNPFSNIIRNTRASIYMAGITSQCSGSINPGCQGSIISHPDSSINVNNDEKFIELMMKDLGEAMPRKSVDLPLTISNIKISRVAVTGGKYALSFN